MKTTFIATVYNEQESIKLFIDSILAQSVIPDEIHIVDAESRDKTLSHLRKYGKKIQVSVVKGNRSVGRNYAIAKAKGEIILVSDAGCVLDNHWVKALLTHFNDKSIDIVSGYYKPETKTVFEKCLSTYTCVMPDKLNPDTFLPSSRSIAFKKSVWKKVGGYPEYLDTCEDLVFAKQLKNSGYTFQLDLNAIVHWRQKSNLYDAFIQLYSYAVGDGMAKYFRAQTPFLYLRYFFVLCLILYSHFISSTGYFILLMLGFIYFVWSILKNYHYVDSYKALLYLPLLQFTVDIAVMTGMVIGIMRRIIYEGKTFVK